MGKISNIILTGIGICAYKYYSKNPKKLDSHKNLAKEKIKNSISYSKNIIKYTEENGINASVDYIKNDVNKLIDTCKHKTNKTINKTLDIIEDGKNISENISEVKEHSIELKNNLKKSEQIINEDLKPKIDKYLINNKKRANSINIKINEIKNILKTNNTIEKINNFKNKTNTTINNTKENLKNIKIN